MGAFLGLRGGWGDSVEFFSAGEHRDDVSQAARFGFGALGCREAVEDGESIGFAERREEGRGFRRGGERFTEFSGHLKRARRRVGRVPAVVGFGGLDDGEARRLHEALAGEALDVAGVDLRPHASSSTRRESLEKRFGVAAASLSVYPPVAEGGVERLGVGDGRATAVFFENAHPKAGVRGMVSLKPAKEFFRIGKADDRFAVGRGQFGRLRPCAPCGGFRFWDFHATTETPRARRESAERRPRFCHLAGPH
jgi:hypothetical protein